MGNRTPRHLHRTLAAAIRTRRLELNLSQEELAQRSGLHRTYLAGLEGGKRNPSLATLEALAQGLGCEAWELLVDNSPSA